VKPADSAANERVVRVAKGAMAAQAREMETDELLRVAKHLRELVASPGWQALSALLEERKSLLMHSAIHGRLFERHEYTAQTGMVSGIEQAQGTPHALIALAQERERDILSKVQEAA
jgi:hypothetical protein